LDITKISEKVRTLAEKYRIIYAILFGSTIEGRFIKGESDIDLAIKELFTFLKSFLNDLNIDNLDVTVTNFSPFSLNYEILTKGRVIFCRDEDELFEDRLKIIKLHEDWTHFSKPFKKREIEKVMK